MTDQKYSKVTNTVAYFFFQINGMIVATLSHEQMIDFLRKPGSVSAVIVPPFQNGKPRKYVSVRKLLCQRAADLLQRHFNRHASWPFF